MTRDDQWSDVWQFDVVHARPGKHPCEKPLPLMEHIIKSTTRPGALVLDCFAGSGTTGVACGRLGREFIGIEMDPHWAKAAAECIGATTVDWASSEPRARIGHAADTPPPSEPDLFTAAQEAESVSLGVAPENRSKKNTPP